jgi:hypothetical protein
MPELREKDIPRGLLRELPRLKKDHKHVYAVKTMGGIFAVRPLLWGEFKFIQEKVEREMSPELFIAKHALLWPDNIPEEAPAGVIHTLASVVINISGFENPVALQSALAQAEYELDQNPEHMIIMTICKAFPAYKPEDLYNLPFLDLIQRFKMAEMMLSPPQEQPQRPNRPHIAPSIRDTETMVFGGDEDFVPEQVSPGHVDPKRDPNLSPPNYEADNAFFRKHFINSLTQEPVPGEV